MFAVIWKKNCSKSFSDTSNSSDIEEEIIKQIKTLKRFDMESRKAVSKKNFVSEEENNYDKEINLTPRNRIGNMDWCKCGCECKPMPTFAESFCLLLCLKSRRTRGASCHSAFIGNSPTISHTRVSLIYVVDEFFFLFLV